MQVQGQPEGVTGEEEAHTTQHKWPLSGATSPIPPWLTVIGRHPSSWYVMDTLASPWVIWQQMASHASGAAFTKFGLLDIIQITAWEAALYRDYWSIFSSATDSDWQELSKVSAETDLPRSDL